MNSNLNSSILVMLELERINSFKIQCLDANTTQGREGSKPRFAFPRPFPSEAIGMEQA